jgi:uncharacterized protein YjiS (DUF1127 family)
MATRIQFDFPAVSDPAYRGSPRFRSPRGLLDWCHATIRRWRERRLLEVLDERMLSDIGISRSQALAEARKPCWRR